MPPEAARHGARIAFFGSVTLAAKELRSALEQRAFPASEVRLFDENGDGVLSEYDGEALVIKRPEEADLAGVDLAFLCGAEAEMERYLDWAGRSGFTAIDLSGSSFRRGGVPLVHAEINPGEIRAPLVAAPHPVSHNLATLAAVARQVAPVRELTAVALLPVSELGEAAIDELYQQTVGLLNFQEVPTEVFERQVAFNLVPASPMDRAGLSRVEGRISAETERLLQWSAGRAFVRAAIAPIFHGHVTHVTLEFEAAPDAGALAAAIESARGTRLVGDPADFTPVALAGEEKVAVGDLRVHPAHPDRLSCWLFCDNLKGGSTLNAARIGERVADRVIEAAR